MGVISERKQYYCTLCAAGQEGSSRTERGHGWMAPALPGWLVGEPMAVRGQHFPKAESLSKHVYNI